MEDVEKPDFIKRLEEEMADLQGKLEKLVKYLDSPMVERLKEKQQILLAMQANTMTTYLGILTLRLEDLGY